MNSGLRIGSTTFKGIRATVCFPGLQTPESFLKPAENTPSSLAFMSTPCAGKITAHLMGVLDA